ncbi:MAG: hypothetical protein HY291_20405 [Planctomycetes bacterium]|nr:hypothetical protein [Planctomycetota bacterium]
MKVCQIFFAVVGTFVVAAAPLRAAESESAGPGVVCHVKVLSDKVEDVSSLEAWKKTYIKDGMSDQEKALEIWKSVATYQHQDSPPLEFTYHEEAVYDPIKIFNVYGYAMCSNASAHITALGRYTGLKVRGWGINCHSVPEIGFDNAWHLFDSSLINYFPKADGKIAGVEEIIAGVKDWYEKNPDYKALKGKELNDKLYKYMKELPPGWKSGPKGWSRGPDVLLRSPTMNENGWHPAKTHGWYSTMQEYDGSAAFPYEYSPTPGYEVNIQLRSGERITRNWSNKGLHVNMDSGGAPGCLNVKSLDEVPHWAKFGNLAPGRVGNGTHEYDVPLASGAFKAGALSIENLACTADDKAAPALHLLDAAKPGEFSLRMPSSYVYLSGQAALKAVVGDGGEIAVALSDNHGADWKEVAKITSSGDQTLELKKYVLRRYDYRLKFTLKGKGTGLDALKITHDIQHSQRPLPILTQGENKIAFEAGAQESTITLDGNFGKHEGKQREYTELHPQMDKFEGGRLAAEEGSITFPVETPGEITRIRMSAGVRNWDDQSSWDLQVSFDGGKSFKTIGQVTPAKSGNSSYAVCAEVPAGTRKALARFAGHKKGDTVLLAFRIDADFKEPHGGFRPVKITYTWTENGEEKKDVHVASKASDAYAIACAAAPVMKSIALEPAE